MRHISLQAFLALHGNTAEMELVYAGIPRGYFGHFVDNKNPGASDV